MSECVTLLIMHEKYVHCIYSTQHGIDWSSLISFVVRGTGCPGSVGIYTRGRQNMVI